MFKNFANFSSSNDASLQVDASGTPTSLELQVAAIALLAEAGRVSGDMGEQELRLVIGGAFQAFGLNDHDAAQTLEISEFLLKDRSKLEGLVEAVRLHFSDPQKIEILTLVWRVIAADGIAQMEEAQFAAALRKKLGLSLEQAMRAQSVARNLIADRTLSGKVSAVNEAENDDSEGKDEG